MFWKITITHSCVSLRLDRWSCQEAIRTEETKNAKADGWRTEEEIEGEENPIRWGEDDRQDEADWSSDW